MHRISALLGVLGLAVLGTLALPAPPAAAHTFTYTVESRGPITSDLGLFAAIAQSTLNDDRGWSLRGALGYTVAEPGDFRLILATPAEVAAAAPVCSTTWSCRVGNQVLINEERWNTGTASWTGPLETYRSYVINHEVGHWLGLRHWSCSGAGNPAPVMQQQSIDLAGCVANTWPLEAELEAVARIHGVDLPPAAHPFGTEIDWLLAEGIAAGYEDGTFRGAAPVSRQAMAAFVFRLAHDGADAPPCTAPPFPDVGVDNQFCGEIAWLDARAVSRGYDDGTYRPTAEISRQAMAAFFYRLFDEATEPPACEVAPFADVGPGDPFCPEIFWMLDTGISTGYGDATYRPTWPVSRQAMAAFMYRGVVEKGLTIT